MKSILFTGASGFLGMNILPMLNEIYDVSTLGISSQMTYNINLAEQIPVLNKRYDIVLHAAGKAHSIPKSPKDAQVFFDVNYQGTRNLCEGLEKSGSPYSLVFISTVAVYGMEYGELIDESHPQNAETPYGKSKIQAEEYLLDWCDRKNVLLTILRPSLLAGKNPPGNLGAMIKGISKGRYFSIAGGTARKSIAMADDIGRLIPYCEEKSGIFNLCDSYNPTFKELEKLISKQLEKPLPLNIPLRPAKYMAKIGDLCNFLPINTQKLEKITKSLTFSNHKIQKELNFIPSDVLSNFLIY
ncbi:UDP-galactose-4-epimerase [Spirochaetia bacterium]|nr:UDP-galactose-4-epimerase [Spirochaetia bacterium]